jgi:DMATS type aromatic prenyltransferase
VTISSEDDIAFWSNHCLPAFSSLLKSTGSYTPEQQASHVDFFKQHIIPNVGPRPVSGAAYLLAHTGSILETSINFSDVGEPIIRFIFQPWEITGIPEAIQADMTWFHQLAAVFCVNEEEKAILKTKLPGLANIPQCLLGFDLHPTKRSMKGYFAPLYKHLLTGENTDPIIFALLKRLEPLGPDFVPALSKLEAFREAEPQRNIDVVGIDCIQPEAGARVKLYTRLTPGVNNFSHIQHQLTLGGRLTDATTLEGVELLRGIWHLLLDEPEDWAARDVSKPENEPPSPHSGIMISWEVQPGKDAPSPKLYVPLWKFSSSNRSIAERYERIFEKWGWDWGVNGGYTSAIRNAL